MRDLDTFGDLLAPLGPAPTAEELDAAAGFTALDWLVRVCTPAWLDAASMPMEAAKLRALTPLLHISAVSAAAEPLREMQTVAYRHSGVLRWSEVDALRPVGALGAKNAAFAAVGYSRLHPDSELVTLVAGYAWTVATYAAHVVPDEQHATVVSVLVSTLPEGVDA